MESKLGCSHVGDSRLIVVLLTCLSCGYSALDLIQPLRSPLIGFFFGCLLATVFPIFVVYDAFHTYGVARLEMRPE